jgi:carbon monoxide dehydrogenase subunit G
MRLRESHALPVPIDDTWKALNDVDLLRQALPGCESLLEIAPNEFVAEMAVALGLATSRFTVHVRRHGIDAPRRCTLHFETRTTGANGTGSAALRLVPDGAECTTLHADIAVSIEGILGLLGGSLVELAAHEMARQFFEDLRILAGARHEQARAADA